MFIKGNMEYDETSWIPLLFPFLVRKWQGVSRESALIFCPFSGCCRRQILSFHEAPSCVVSLPPPAVIKDQFIILWGTLLCHILLLDTQYPWISWYHPYLLSMNVGTLNTISIFTCVGTILSLFNIHYCNVTLCPHKVTAFVLYLVETRNYRQLHIW